VRFSGRKIAHRPRSACVAATAVSRPMRSCNYVDEVGRVVGVARDAESWRVHHLVHL
jgi:hypothetical protein